uniref:SnoaL-like domain-containing protein n=1 Tax=Mycena chlorophos TaxID=658473 RepID=A0ABQ0LV36_MYCCL|nr:predicted protein [Mycena chlorophos]
MLDFLDGAHHAFTTVLVDLPQPSAASPIEKFPREATGTCNYLITLKRANAMGDPLLQSGGYYNFKFIRSSLEDKTGNPWRLAFFKENTTYARGNTDVVKNPTTNSSWL